MRLPTVLFAALVWPVVAAQFASASSVLDQRLCLDGKDADPALRAEACSRIIRTSGEPTQNRAIAYFNRALAYYDLGDLDRAIQDLTEALRLQQDYYAAYVIRGSIFHEQKKYDLAIQDFNQAIKLRPNFFVGYYNRARAFHAKRLAGLAMRDYDEAIRLRPDVAAIYSDRGALYADLGRYERAIQDYDQAIRLNPKEATTFSNRGNSYRSLGQYDRSLSDYNEAIRLAPDDAQAYNGRGVLLTERGQYEAAVRDFDMAISLAPNDGLYFANRGAALNKLGQFDRAIADLEKGILLEPNLGDWARSALAEARAAKAAMASRTVTLSSATRRIAMVIGNSQYPYIGNLKNAENDAARIALALKANGYEIVGPAGSVSPFLNLTKSQMEAALDAFQKQSETAEVALIWYAGHGSSFKIGDQQRDNFLLPVDFRTKDGPDILSKGISVERMKRAVTPSSQLRILIIDACRDNNVETPTRGLMRGMLPEARNQDMIVMFSTQPGAQAADGEGDLSPFAEGFLEELSVNPRAFILNFLTAVSGRVKAKTDPDQVPEIFTSVADPKLTLVR